MSSSEPPKKDKQAYGFKYLSLIVLLCTFSFVAAVVIHWDGKSNLIKYYNEFTYTFLPDIGWLTKEFTTANENKTVPTAAPLRVSSTTITIPLETCPVEPQEEYRIHLLMCERTRTFEDCCHEHIRSRVAQINDVCSVLEMLDLLVEHKRIYIIRKERNIDVEYKEDDFKKEEEKKEQEKKRTKEKILSYIRHLNKPLQREIPALFDWFGDLFLEYQDEFETKNIKEHSKTQNSPQSDEEDHEIYNSSPDDYQTPGAMKTRESENHSDNNSTQITIEKTNSTNNKKHSFESIQPVSEVNDVNFSTTEEVFTEKSTGQYSFTTEMKLSEIEKSSTTQIYLPQSSVKMFPEKTHAEEKKELTRRKRDEINESYNIGDRPFPQYDNSENDVFESNPFYETNQNMETNQNGMQPNEMYPMENYGNQVYNNVEEEGPSVALSPEMLMAENPQYVGYHSLMNNEQREDELRLPIHTEERDFGRQTWKDMNVFGLTHSVTLPPDTPRMNLPNFMMTNDQVTYSYLDPIAEPPRTATEKYQEEKTTLYAKDMEFTENQKYIQTETTIRIPVSTPTSSMINELYATDSIENIENIRAKNESVFVDIGKTKIVVSKADEETNKSIEELNGTDEKEAISVTENIGVKEISQKETTQFYTTVSDRHVKNTDTENFRNAAQQTKGNGFQILNEETQSSQFVNPSMCQIPQPLGSPNRFVLASDNRPQTLNMMPSMNVPKSPVYMINPSVFSYIPPSPMIPHYGPIPQQFNPYAFINPLSAGPMSTVPAAPVQMANNNGQVLVCSPAAQQPSLSSSNSQTVEIRSASNLQDSFDMIRQHIRTK